MNQQEKFNIEPEEANEIPVNIKVSSKDQDDVSAKEQSGNRSEEYLEHLKRLQAEFNNYRKRTEKEKESLYQYAQGSLTEQLLPVLDDLDRLIVHHEKDETCSMQGVMLIHQKLMKVLTEAGLEVIIAKGKKFNPEYHEALDVEETNQKQDNTILEEWQRGYRFRERLLRPSGVKVGRYIEKGADESE